MISIFGLILFGMAIVAFLAKAAQTYVFGYLSNKVTHKIRQVLYDSLLEKHLGWYDDRDHSTGVLVSSMAEDSTIINGSSANSLAPQFEATFSILTGVTVALVYCW